MKQALRSLLALFLLAATLCTPFLTACSAGLVAEEKTAEEKTAEERPDAIESEETAEVPETEKNPATPVTKTNKKPDPKEDNEMNVLFIGNSYCYYWMDEFVSMLSAEGYENITVCNVYYSGCSLAKHVQWLMDRESNYKLYIHTVEGEKIKEKVNLKTCLDFANWDSIILLDGGRTYYTKGIEYLRETARTNLPTLLNYIRKICPDARYFWQENWVHELGIEYNTVEEQLNFAAMNETVAKEICEEYGMTRIPLGSAWRAIRHEPILREGGRTLTTRIFKGKPEHDDLSHDGDVGGGQLLNACVSYEVITEKSCLDNSFVPHYEFEGQDLSLSEEKIALLKKAAHETVAGVYGEDFAK